MTVVRDSESTIPGITDPRIDGRTAANNVNATDYLRPKDLEIGTLANGNQVLCVATTTDDRVLPIERIGCSRVSYQRDRNISSQIDIVRIDADSFNGPLDARKSSFRSS